MPQSVDVTRCTVHNGKPPTAVKAARGLLVNQADAWGCLCGSEHPKHKQASGSGQGGFAS